MRTFLLTAATVAGLALTAGTADAQYRSYRGGYNRPVYSNGYVARPYSGFNNGGYRSYSGFNNGYGYGYPRSGLSLSFGSGGYFPGYGGNGFYPGYGSGFGSYRGFGGYPGYPSYRRW